MPTSATASSTPINAGACRSSNTRCRPGTKPSTAHFVITQIWDHNNVAVAVIYYKEWTGGNITWITHDEINELWLANTAGQGAVHWICSTDSTPQTMIWSSPDIPTIVHVEIIPSGDHWTHCLSVVASPEAAELLLKFKRAQ
jgi:hypothetical protein